VNVTNEFSTVRKNFINYLKAQGKASSTILAYGKDIEQLSEFLTKKQLTRMSSVLPEHLEEFKSYLSDNQYLPKTVCRKLNSIKTFFRYLESENLITQNPAKAIPQPKYQLKPPRILSKMEYRALRDVARNDPRVAAIIELLLQTGLRISEVTRLKMEDIANKDEIKVSAFESHPERKIPLSPAAQQALARYLEVRPQSNSKIVFLTKTSRPLKVRNMRALLTRYFKLAGIEDATVNDLRHTFIVHQLMAGVPAALIQKLVGHKRRSTTEKYLTLIKEKIEVSPQLQEL